jgi:hypothetical protein
LRRERDAIAEAKKKVDGDFNNWIKTIAHRADDADDRDRKRRDLPGVLLIIDEALKASNYFQREIAEMIKEMTPEIKAAIKKYPSFHLQTNPPSNPTGRRFRGAPSPPPTHGSNPMPRPAERAERQRSGRRLEADCPLIEYGFQRLIVFQHWVCK